MYVPTCMYEIYSILHTNSEFYYIVFYTLYKSSLTSTTFFSLVKQHYKIGQILKLKVKMNCQTFRETYFLLLLLILNLTLISSSYSSSRASKKYFQVANDWYETTYQSTTPSPPPSQSESTSTPRILFPPGISLEFQPTLTIPFINKDAFGIGSSFKVSFPVTSEQNNMHA